ncbi:MAG: hypothetical protein WBV96_19810 [Polyangia bacterium]
MPETSYGPPSLVADVKSCGVMEVVEPATVLSTPVHTQPCQFADVTFQSEVCHHPGGFPLMVVPPPEELVVPPEELVVPPDVLLEELVVPPEELVVPPEDLLEELVFPPEGLEVLPGLLVFPPEGLEVLPGLPVFPPEGLDVLPGELLFPPDWPVFPPPLPPPLAGAHPTTSPTAKAGMRSARRKSLPCVAREVIRGPPLDRSRTFLAMGSGNPSRKTPANYYPIW